MNTLFRRSISEYKKQTDLKSLFAIHTERLTATVKKADFADFERLPFELSSPQKRFLLLLAPLVHIAWADGRVTQRETDAILQAADAYGIVDHEPSFCELMRNLTSRPMTSITEKVWRRFEQFFEHLSERERETVEFCLLVQARFVAGQSSNDFISFLRGDRVCEREKAELQQIGEKLQQAKEAAEIRQLDRKETVVITESDESEFVEMYQDYSRLIPLVPLVKTAWAEGRVTKRERQLVFEAAARMGIKTGTTAHQRLTEWLELHPTDEFYDRSLEVLRQRWQQLPQEEKDQQKFSLLSDCTRIAEASGGSKNFPGGGVRICDEEITAVKRIARRLGGEKPLALK